METLEYPFHKGARTSLYVAAALCILLVCAAPIGAYFIYRIGKGKVSINGTSIKAEGLMTDEIAFSDIDRIGLLNIPMVARGLGGMLARMKLNNMDYGINLVAKLKNGKNVKFLLNQYERHDEIIEKVKAAVPNLQMEQIPMGLLSWKWPERVA